MRRYYLDIGIGEPPIALAEPDFDVDEGECILYDNVIYKVGEVDYWTNDKGEDEAVIPPAFFLDEQPVCERHRPPDELGPKGSHPRPDLSRPVNEQPHVADQKVDHGCSPSAVSATRYTV